MRTFYTLIFTLFFPFFVNAQNVNLSGQCMTGTITLSKIADIDGRAAFQGTGTVLGYEGITVSVYWIGGSDNVWVIDFDGQPYFMNTCNTLLPSSTGNESCKWTAVDGTACTGGAPLVVNGSGVLPVGLIGFTAQEIDNKVSIAWKTTSEINNKGFEIQRSRDAITWNRIGFVNASLSSSLENNYSYNDIAPLQGRNFYRLVQYDMDGRTTISPVVNVDFFKDGYFSLANNPGNGIYLLNIRSANGGKILVSDMTGRRLMTKQLDAGIHQLDISNYTKGTYLLQIQMGTKTFIEKLIKQ